MASQNLADLCRKLQSCASTAERGLRDLVFQHPQYRLDLNSLLRDLAEIDTASRLLDHNGQQVDLQPDTLPSRLITALKDVVRKTTNLIEEITQTYLEVEGPREHLVEGLTSLKSQVESCRIALNLGLDALLFARNSQPSNANSAPPTYDSSQMGEGAVILRSRLSTDGEEGSGFDVSAQTQTLGEFSDALGEFTSQTAPRSSGGRSSYDSPPPPPPPPPGVNMDSESSDLHDIPAYNAINFSNMTPQQISLRRKADTQIARGEVLELCFLTYNSSLAIAAYQADRNVTLFDINLSGIKTMPGQQGPSMVFSPEGRTLAYRTTDDNSDVQLVDLVAHRKIKRCPLQTGRPLAFSPDGKFFAVGDGRGRVSIVDVPAGAPLNKAPVIWCHTEQVTHGMFTHDGQTLVTLSTDGSIRLTDPWTRASLAKLETDIWKRPSFLGISADNSVITSIWGDIVYHWNPTTGGLESFSLGGMRNREGWPIAISADCRFICCRNDDGVDVSDLHTGRVLGTIKFRSGFVTAATFSPDGKYLALGIAESAMDTRGQLNLLKLVF